MSVIKCLVWDLDNTLWRGTLLEDGEVSLVEGAREVIEALDARGILQSVSSRNDHELAWARLTELGLAGYFVLPMIGWGRKSDSVLEIAERLNFAHSAMAFIDDQAHERAEVAFHAPDVRCYPAERLDSLLGMPEFTPQTVTEDSRRRRQMYQASFRRDEEKATFSGPDEEFLRSLDLVMEISRAGEVELSRVEELTLRTSQMNATGVHYSHSALRALLDDPGHEVLTAAVTDRFGPYGAVGVILLARHDASWHLKLLATSCRVVSFGAGTVILNWLADQAARAGVHLVADFRATDRNRIMEIAYRFGGFAEEPCRCTAGIEPGAPGVQRLHLVPDRRPPAATMKLHAPDLTSDVCGRG